jgi:hypothetical protein
MNNWFKRYGMHFAVAAIFLVICFFYFTPAFQGKTLGQVDVLGAQSTQKEINDYKAKGITILWTNQILGGMPAYQIWAPYADNITTWIVNEMVVIFPNPIYDVLLLMFGTYFLFTVLKLNPWLAAAGAIAFTFSSYNIILLVAGHSNQALAIAFFAPIIASVILTLRGKYVLGGALTAFFMAMEFKANHIQMTYYLLMALVILICIELYHAIKAKTTNAFVKSISTLGVAMVLALMVNASLLWSTQEYAKYSYRGPANLTQHTAEPSNGLSKTYAYEYSQGVGECFTFFIPDAYGGASGANESIDQNSATAKVFIAKQVPEDQAVTDAQQITSQFPGLGMYWGNKPGTAGPFYFGAVICFLFVFGLLIVKSRIKWWLLGTVLLTMLLSFGANMPVLSDLFFDYFPLYNKFRTVESILAVASICFPILAFLAVREMIETKDKKIILKKLMLTLYISGGLALLLLALPTVFFSFKPAMFETGITYLTQALKGDSVTADVISKAIVDDRVSLERADALRTLIFVGLTFALLWAFIKQKVNLTVLSIGLLVLVTIDMWQVDRRYLKDSNFQDRQDASEQIRPRGVDSLIARDPDPDFRVFDLSDAANIKMDNFNPFFHKSISGYSAARLKRYDELLDNQFAKSVNIDVLDMLNTKYIIVQTDPKTQTLAVQGNKAACGNAWFVKTIKYVNNADEEMASLTAFPAKTEAIVDVKYKSQIPQTPLSADSTSTIKLTSYSPDDMVYKSSASTTSVAVFSEIYYDKGWTMTIDGKEQPYFRADYLLRAAQIPAGSHTVEFVFHPASYYTGEKISLAGSILLVLALGGAGYTELRKKKA